MVRTINNTLKPDEIADIRAKYRFDPDVQRLCEALEVAQAGVAELCRTSAAVCLRLQVNELVNRPEDPCNQYDQPAYDAAMKAIRHHE